MIEASEKKNLFCYISSLLRKCKTFSVLLLLKVFNEKLMCCSIISTNNNEMSKRLQLRVMYQISL
jgi:hypothetical protein